MRAGWLPRPCICPPQGRTHQHTHDLGGLQGFLGLADGADRGGFGNASDEPVTLVMPAEEFALFLAFRREEKFSFA